MSALGIKVRGAYVHRAGYYFPCYLTDSLRQRQRTRLLANAPTHHAWYMHGADLCAFLSVNGRVGL